METWLDLLPTAALTLLPLYPDRPLVVPYCENPVQAGYPVTFVDDTHARSDLRRLMRISPTSIAARVKGQSMIDARFLEGDVIIIDTAARVEEGSIVVAQVDGLCTVKEYHYDTAGNRVILRPKNPDFAPIIVTEEQQFFIVGVVTGVYHAL